MASLGDRVVEGKKKNKKRQKKKKSSGETGERGEELGRDWENGGPS